MKCFVVILILVGCLCNSLAIMENNASTKILNLTPRQSLIYHLTVNFLSSCGLNLKNIIIYNRVTNQDTFFSIGEIQPQTSVTLLSNVRTWQQVNQYRFDDINVDAVVIVVDMKIIWYLMKDVFMRWPFNRDCIVYIIPVPLRDCSGARLALELIMRFYFPAAYFICLFEDRYTNVYTYDPYGDTEPPHWHKVVQGIHWGKNRTVYKRFYDRDMRELCTGFNFQRTDPTDKVFPILGVYNKHVFAEDYISEKVIDDEIEDYLDPDLSDRAFSMKRMLNIKFKYYIVNSPSQSVLTKQAYDTTSIDAFLYPRFTVAHNFPWNFFHSTDIGPYALLSYNQGFLTPLEKIAKFYGKWTLVSLMMLLGVTFLVIWVRTKRVHLATFDIIKLLINSDVSVPLDSRALKFFFSMIFLYFMVIHATFSGHLAEFLTSVERRKNIDTIEDLLDPKVEKIYVYGYQFDDSKEYDVLRKKSERIGDYQYCIRIKDQFSSACISSLSGVQIARAYYDDYNNTYHISKNTFDISMLSSFYRPGFPLQEKLNWAIMYLFDTSIINHEWDEVKQSVYGIIEIHIQAAHFEYRRIKVRDLHFCFYILIIGNLLGLVCFLCEIGFKMISKRDPKPSKCHKTVRINVKP